MQTAQGLIKAKQKMIEKYGLTEDGRSKFYVEIGKQGGKVGRTGGFYVNKDLASKAGEKGGLLSRKGTPLSPEERQVILNRMETNDIYN
jgi:general stress protein YciG